MPPAFRALLSEALDVAVDADRVRARITHAMEREERSWKRVASLAAVAATLVVAVAVAYWTGRRVDASAYDDSAGDHVACALTYPEGTLYDPDRAAQNLVSPFEHIVDAVGLSHGIYHVIDAHMCPYTGRNYAHVVIRGDISSQERRHCGFLGNRERVRCERTQPPAAALEGKAID